MSGTRGVNIYQQNTSGAPGGSTQQAFNPYGSYASSNTYYDPNQQYNSQPGSLGPKADAYSMNTRYSNENGASHGLPENQYGAPKAAYAPGGYAEGPPRSPSPTPSELEEQKRGVVDWKVVLNWRTYAKKKYIPWYIGGVLILVLVALMTLYHKQIVHWLTPAANWMHKLKYGYLIPVAVLFVISFPPLFGHEIVAVLCGVVWGLWIGFAIVCAGTLLGEIGNFYAFKYCCSARGEKLEKTKLSYACLARVVREGGFKIALIARLSAIPGHFTTAVFSTCGMGIIVFTIAAILSLPKQFITVYLGVILEQSGDPAQVSQSNKNSRIISDVVLAVTFLITVAAGWYIWREMNRVQPAVLKDRRREKRKLAAQNQQPETQYLARSSNADLSSEEEMTPVKPNEQRLGAYGYSGYAGSGESRETFNVPIPKRADGYNGGAEAYAMKETKIQHPYSDPYGNQSYASYDGGPFSDSRDDASSHHTKVSTNPPHIDDVSNLTGSRRIAREGLQTSEGASTVGMGSWGGILKEGSDASQDSVHQPSQPTYAKSHPTSFTPGSPTTPRPQQQFAQPQPSRMDEYGVLHQQAGLGALGAPMGGGGTVSVTPRSGPGARTSVEVSNPLAGRSMRGVVEDTHDTDLGYMQASPPNASNLHTPTASSFSTQAPPRDPASNVTGYTGSYHTAQGTNSSQNTFGAPRSLHSREFAATGSSGTEGPHMPGSYRR